MLGVVLLECGGQAFVEAGLEAFDGADDGDVRGIGSFAGGNGWRRLIDMAVSSAPSSASGLIWDSNIGVGQCTFGESRPSSRLRLRHTRSGSQVRCLRPALGWASCANDREGELELGIIFDVRRKNFGQMLVVIKYISSSGKGQNHVQIFHCITITR